MSVESKLPDDHPMMIAWAAHKENAGYQNALNWIKGAMWNCFAAGYTAANKPKTEGGGDGRTEKSN